MLALHELLQAGGRIEVADLLEFLEGHGKFGVGGSFLLAFALAADALGLLRRAGRFLGFLRLVRWRLLRLAHIAERLGLILLILLGFLLGLLLVLR